MTHELQFHANHVRAVAHVRTHPHTHVRGAGQQRRGYHCENGIGFFLSFPFLFKSLFILIALNRCLPQLNMLKHPDSEDSSVIHATSQEVYKPDAFAQESTAPAPAGALGVFANSSRPWRLRMASGVCASLWSAAATAHTRSSSYSDTCTRMRTLGHSAFAAVCGT